MTRSGAVTTRHERIRELLLEHGSVRSDELVSQLDVSLMTVHRDLDALERQGWLRRSHGGATIERSVLYELNVRSRMVENLDAKKAIARAAAGLIERGDAIILDDSTTSLALVEAFGDAEPGTIVTNFRKIIDVVAGTSDANLIALGGQYHSSYDSFFGSGTVDILSTLHADKVFVSSSAITDGACFHQVPESIAVKRAMLQAAGTRILLVDHSKFQKRALHRLCALEDFDITVTDAAIAPEDLELLRERCPRVVVAPA